MLFGCWCGYKCQNESTLTLRLARWLQVVIRRKCRTKNFKDTFMMSLQSKSLPIRDQTHISTLSYSKGRTRSVVCFNAERGHEVKEKEECKIPVTETSVSPSIRKYTDQVEYRMNNSQGFAERKIFRSSGRSLKDAVKCP